MQELTSFDPALKDTHRRKKMPISQYFKGRGTEVMKKMEETYPSKAKAHSVFHATAEKRKEKPDSKLKASMREAMRGRGGSRPGRNRD
jgi:hypothetical protein